MLGVGTAFAGYEIEGVLGQGGMGTVYLARHPRLPRSVALKLLNREVSTDPELARRFELEADVVARLEHPGIVGVFDRGVDDGHLWIAMQYVRGVDGAAWNARAHPAATTVALIGETAAALDYAHSRGVLHRDVKPGNILIADADGGRPPHAVLTDFGIARLTDADTKLTATGTFTATLAYGSPEQLAGEVVDHRSDQYSLACTLFAILTGHAPYEATNPAQVIMGHMSGPVPQLTTHRPDLPPAVDTVLARAMAKNRDDRFASCTDFTTAMQAGLAGQAVAVPVPRSAPTVLQQPRAAYTPAPAPAPGMPVPGFGSYPPAMPFPIPPPSGVAAIYSGVLMTILGLTPSLALVVAAFVSGSNGYLGWSLFWLVPTGLLWGSGVGFLRGHNEGRIGTAFWSLLATLGAIYVGFVSLVNGQNLAIVLASAIGIALLLLSIFASAVSPFAKKWVEYKASQRPGYEPDPAKSKDHAVKSWV